MPHDSALYRELVKLRSRESVGRAGLDQHLGPEIRRLARLTGDETAAQVRTAVESLLRTLMEDLAPHVQQAALSAFALEKAYRFPKLEDRIERLATEQKISRRTARRRMDEALAAMAVAGEETETADPPGDAAAKSGWRVSSLEALYRLDTPLPELYELRRIVVTREIDEIVVRVGLPMAPAEVGELRVEALFGARVRTQERQAGSTNYKIVLGLPGTLTPGEQHDIWLRFVLPPGHPTWPHYAIVPLDPCESGTVRVRFAPDRRPGEIWLLDDVPYTDLHESPAEREPVELTGTAEVYRRFGGMRQGHGYGIAWAAAGAETGARRPSE